MKSIVVLYKGFQGDGKTLTMVKDGFNYHSKGLKVYSNFWTSYSEKIDNNDIINLDKSEIGNCTLMIDEIQVIIDSRRSGRKSNVDLSYFFQQLRKRGIILLFTTQFSINVDLRLRQHINVIVKPKFIEKYNFCEASYMDATIMEEDIIMPVLIKVVFDAIPVFKMYKTDERITPVQTLKGGQKKKNG